MEVQAHEERRVGADRRLAVGIGNSVVLEDSGQLVVGVSVGVGKTVAGVGVAVGASRIDYHHNRSSRTMRTAQRVDAAAGPAEGVSIVGYRFRDQAAGRDCDLHPGTSTKNNPPGVGVEGEDQEGEAVVVDCKMKAKKDFFA